MKSDSLVNVLVDLTERLKESPLTGDRDVDIVTELIEHHKATIGMNEILLRDGSKNGLKEFARRLTEIQLREIGQMEAFLASHPPVSGVGKRGLPEVMNALHSAEPTDDLDAAYISLMRMHLEYGISAARKEHERGLHEDMRIIAGAIMRSGEAFVGELEELVGSPEVADQA